MSLYIPTHFVPRERSAIVHLMHDHPFATLITPVCDQRTHDRTSGQPVGAVHEPVITHLPLIHVADCEPHGTLFGHFARTNLHTDCAEGAESLAVFHGPHAYVSPSLYADPASAVPTWNYAVVHAHGMLHLATEPAETRGILDAMIKRFEGPRAQPWKLALEGARLEAMVGAIIGFRLRIKRIEAKFKMSQNRSREDQRLVAAALADAGDADSAATAAWMRGYADANRGKE